MVRKLYAIMPVYNESQEIVNDTIKKTLQHVDKVILVNDGSRIQYSYIDTQNVIVIDHSTNLGKGAALRTGCKYAALTGAKDLLLIDSDGQHNPEEIPSITKAYDGNNVILGYREFNKKMPLTNKIGNIIINLALFFLFGIKVKDSQCGLKVIPSKFLNSIMWLSSDYNVETEILINMKQNNIPWKEAPIKTIYVDAYKRNYVWSGIQLFYNIILWRILK